jgi:hypothetical protein
MDAGISGAGGGSAGIACCELPNPPNVPHAPSKSARTEAAPRLKTMRALPVLTMLIPDHRIAVRAQWQTSANWLPEQCGVNVIPPGPGAPAPSYIDLTTVLTLNLTGSGPSHISGAQLALLRHDC